MSDIRFVTPQLASLDDLDSEVIMCAVWSDTRPSRGVAGLCDFRFGGWISDLQRRKRITGALGEAVLLPGKPGLTIDKLVIFGAGPKAEFDDDVFEVLVERFLMTADDLCARAAVLELPGRPDGLISAERAADILFTLAGSERTMDLWTLVEPPEGRQRMTELVIEERKRLRRVY